MRFIFAISILLLHAFSFSQNTFQTVFGGTDVEYSRGILQTWDDDFLIIGMTKSYGSGNSDISITRLDSIGNIKWSKILGTSVRDAAYQIMVNPTGGYIVAAWILNDPPSYDDWYIFTVDDDGNILSETFFGGYHDDEIMDMELTPNNEFILAGSTWSFASSLVDICIARMDQNLDFLWSKTFGTGVREYSRSIIQSSDGNYIVVGGQKDYDNTNNRIIILKIDETGNLIWSKKYTGSNEDWGFDIIETIDGNYLTVGYTNSYGAGNYDILINKINTNGNLIWAKTYGGLSDDKAFEIKKGSNDSYFISGFTSSFGAGGYDALLLNIDSDGNVIGSFTFGGEYDEEKRTYLEKTSDGGFIIATQTKSYGSGNFDNFIIKTDETGNSCCGVEITNLSVNNASPEVSSLNLSIGSGEGYPTHNIITDEIEFPNEYICIDSLNIIGEDTVCAFATDIQYSINPKILIELIWILPEGATISQSFSDTTILVNFSNQSGYIYLQADGCNDDILDSLFVIVSEGILPDLGNDTLICSNEPLILDPGNGYIFYQWQDGSTDTIYFVNTSGVYWIEVMDSIGCIYSDTIYIEIYPSPEINLGNDTLICAGDSLILNAGGGFESYLWNTGSLDSIIVIDTSGLFWVEVTNEFGCSTTDSIHIEFYPYASEELELGNDTTLCFGDMLILSAGAGYTYYEWHDGSHDSIFIADTAGVYYVYVENPCGSGSDTIVLDIFPVTDINLGNDTTVCFGEFVFLDAGEGFNSYLWQDGSSNQFYYAGQTGTYWVEVTDTNFCSVSDTINLEFILPDPGLGNDTSICYGDSVTFFASDGFVGYLWQNGTDSIWLTADTTGIYWCEVIDTMGCIGSDSVFLETVLLPNISLGNDTGICLGDSIFLNILPLDNGFDFIWQDGSTDSVFLVTEQGEYWVQASNECGTDTDSVFVSDILLPFVFLGKDTILALNDEIILDAGNGFESFLWNDNTTAQTLLVSDTGSYWVKVSDGTCFNSDTINIERIKCDLFVPIVFTPNQDGFNDYFFAMASDDITDFELIVFNRWGEKVWEINNHKDKWDGKKNGRPAATGTYFWITKYKCFGSPQEFIKKGSVTLLR